VIRSVEIKNAPWLRNKVIELNDGLVTIIGAKGSGKTALAELIAFAADGNDSQPGEASFIKKAGSLLDNVAIDLKWDDGSSSPATIPCAEPEVAVARVRYLSQQFVERLCSPGGLADPLVEEIEEVVFKALPYEDQLQCGSFTELREVRLADPMAEQEAVRQAIRSITRQVADELALEKSVPILKANLQNVERDRKATEKAITVLPIKASEEKVKAQQRVAAELQALKKAIAEEGRRTQSLRDLESDVRRQIHDTKGTLADFKIKYTSILSDEDWKLLEPQIPEQALSRLAELVEESRKKAVVLREKGLPVDAGKTSAEGSGWEPVKPYGLAALEAENKKVIDELGLDHANARKRASLETRLTTSKQKEEKAKQQLAYAEGARERRQSLQTKRLEEYERLFNALTAEEETLKALYQPLSDQIESNDRLRKLSFVVKRIVDIDAWAKRGEQLLDLRKPPFQKHGALAGLAKEEILASWTEGTPVLVSAALKAFMDKHGSEAMKALKDETSLVEFGEWLFSTDHISVRYTIEYEGVDVSNLSPGTKGVVLLALYLGLDQWDQRPLVIDQPEENLDPRSVYTDLVPFFRAATRRRQIIMVTHNANLVVNADSDQVIVANAQREFPKQLPKIEYVAGGLENPLIRSQVCDLLEGGKEAFIRRGQRYGFIIDQSVP
jgi:energy-coupling factor transporter ATP-binding protein EcfA2